MVKQTFDISINRHWIRKIGSRRSTYPRMKKVNNNEEVGLGRYVGFRRPSLYMPVFSLLNELPTVEKVRRGLADLLSLRPISMINTHGQGGRGKRVKTGQKGGKSASGHFLRVASLLGPFGRKRREANTRFISKRVLRKRFSENIGGMMI